MARKSHSVLSSLCGFAVSSKQHSQGVLPDISLFDEPPPSKGNLLLPFNIDAEFVDNLQGVDLLEHSHTVGGRQGVTVQIRGIAEADGIIFVHPDHVDYAYSVGKQDELRHPIMDGDSHCIVADWLKARGIDAQIFFDPDAYSKTRRTCRLMACAHFALADFEFLASSVEFKSTLVELFRTRRVVMGRRLMAKASGHTTAKAGIVALQGWLMTVDGHTFRLSLEVVDTAAMHGIAGYAELAANVGFALEAKANISRKGVNADITRMHEIYFERPADFDSYAEGDLYVSDIIAAYGQIAARIWNGLGIPHRYKPPKLTVGSTVADLLAEKIIELIDPAASECSEDLLEATTGTHNAAYLSRYVAKKSPIAMLSKVDGGRCRCAKPTIATMFGALADIDIASAYGGTMTVVPIVLGKPRQFENGNAKDSSWNPKDAVSLKEWTRRHEHQLVDRCWYARINTIEPFGFESDLIPSWFGWKIAIRKSDSENVSYDRFMDSDSGELKHFTREIWSGTLTSDLLAVARGTMSANQFEEWSSKIAVRSALYVNQRDFLPVEQYREKFHAGTLDEHAWTFLTVGELLVDYFVAVRKTLQKQGRKGDPFEILNKLYANTTYGVSVSKFFNTSSTITGSNITSCVRSFMYLAEKGLNLVGSITDGQLFDLNKVLHPRQIVDKRRPPEQWNRRPSDLSLSSRAYHLSEREYHHDAKANLKPLVGDHIQIVWNGEQVELHVRDGTETRVYIGKDALKFVDDAAIGHIRKLWPTIPIVRDMFKVPSEIDEHGHVVYSERQGLFAFETKRLVTSAALHGSANYLHIAADPTKPVGPKMRSFETNRQHQAFTINSKGNLIKLDAYADQSPAHVLLNALLENPNNVPILPPFIKQRILKPAMFAPAPIEAFDKSGRLKKRYRSVKNLTVLPGDSVPVIGRPRWFSLAQHVFQTRSQYESWRKANNRLLGKYGLSFEQFFIEGERLNYQAMIVAIDAAITQGVNDPIGHFAKQRARKIPKHVQDFDKAIVAMREHLNGLLIDEDERHYEYITDDEGDWE